MRSPAEAYEEFLSNPDQDTLAHLPRFRAEARGNVLEIGVFEGASTSAFLCGVGGRGGHVYSVDMNPACADVFAGNPQWTFIRGDSRRDARKVMESIPGAIDVLYIDGDHSYLGCLADLLIYTPLVRRGGIVMVHDVEPPNDPCRNFPGVPKAFIEFVKEYRLPYEIAPESCGLGIIRIR